jgi:hypothetical protein
MKGILFQEQQAAVDGWNTQIQQLTEERDKLATSYEETSKVFIHFFQPWTLKWKVHQ